MLLVVESRCRTTLPQTTSSTTAPVCTRTDVLKVVDFVVNMMDFVLKTMGCAANPDAPGSAVNFGWGDPAAQAAPAGQWQPGDGAPVEFVQAPGFRAPIMVRAPSYRSLSLFFLDHRCGVLI